MKKFLYTLMIAALMLINATEVKASNEVYYINSNDIEMTEREYNNLLELGFTRKQIDYMNYDEFVSNKDIEATLVSETTQYVKTTTKIKNGIKSTNSVVLTEEEIQEDMMMQSQLPPYSPNVYGEYYDGMTQTYYKRVTTYIANVSSSYMRYKTDMDWLNMPTEKYADIIGIGIESSKVHMSSSVIFHMHYETSGGTMGDSTAHYPKITSTGGVTLYNLPTGSLADLESYVYFNVAKNAGVSNVTHLTACGDYAHATSSVNPSDVLNYLNIYCTSGIDVDVPYFMSYDEIPAAVGSFEGSW